MGALRLLRQAGVEPVRDDDELDDVDDGELPWEEVEGFATHRPRPTARRNDPCPCGSGRKYKACHLGRETHALDDRAGWLYLKARRFLRDRRPLAVDELAALVVDEISQPELFDALVDGPFLQDLVLHEEGAFGEFLAARDSLLLDDEALLAAQWALADRGVFEVLDTTSTQLELRRPMDPRARLKNQDSTVIASARRAGDELTVEVNSAERAAELQLLVADAIPDAELVDLEAHPFDMSDQPPSASERRPAALDDPAIRAALAEHVAGLERRWLDESIPRSAAAHPRRGQRSDRARGPDPAPGIAPRSGPGRRRRHEPGAVAAGPRVVSTVVEHGSIRFPFRRRSP